MSALYFQMDINNTSKQYRDMKASLSAVSCPSINTQNHLDTPHRRRNPKDRRNLRDKRRSTGVILMNDSEFKLASSLSTDQLSNYPSDQLSSNSIDFDDIKANVDDISENISRGFSVESVNALDIADDFDQRQSHFLQSGYKNIESSTKSQSSEFRLNELEELLHSKDYVINKLQKSIEHLQQ
ncbi:hypothetical protein GJ496_003845, partial [Pomphorhynchus laevis]